MCHKRVVNIKVLFVHSHTFQYDDEGVVYSDGKLPYEVWRRYLNHFDELVVVGRGRKIKDNKILKEANVSSGHRVKHIFLPSLTDIKRRIRNKAIVVNRMEEIISEVDAVIARMPSEYSEIAIRIAARNKKMYGVELVGDVFNSLWNHGHIFGKLLAPISMLKNKKIVKQAPFVLYVTQKQLQEIYPNTTGRQVGCSNVEIPSVDEAVLLQRLERINATTAGKKIRIGLIGSYASKYKGIDTAIRALDIIRQSGHNAELRVLGNGDPARYIKLAKELYLEDKVFFDGSLPGGGPVLRWLDEIDLYIQPSKTEGLPRSLVEAMSRGCPSVASSVGGIPELLPPEHLHPAGDYRQLAGKLLHLLKDQTSMAEAARRNFAHASQYSSPYLNKIRDEFWHEFAAAVRTGRDRVETISKMDEFEVL